MSYLRCNTLTKIVAWAAASLFGSGLNASLAAQPPSGDAAVWHDELSYGYMDIEDDKEARSAFKFAKRHGNYKDYYARFRLGNLYFVDGSTPAPRFTQDLDGKSGRLGVIMGKKPRLVSLPDAALFAQFMAAIRPNPEMLSLERRFRAMEYLAGTGEILTKREIERSQKYNAERYQLEPQEPRWIEENGTLLFDYYTYRHNGDSMMAPYLVKCQLRVDSAQKYTISCDPVPERNSP